MKPLLAIRSCHRYSQRAQNLRDTWLPDVPRGLDYHFFTGLPTNEFTPCPYEDTVVLPCGDTYKDLPSKTQAICDWALGHDYEWVHMLDDDVYARPERLLAAVPVGSDYVGRKRGPSCPCHMSPEHCDLYPADYCSGFSYWLSARAMSMIVYADLDPNETAEDRWVGNVLHREGIEPVYDGRYSVIPEAPPPTRHNQQITACEFPTAIEMKLAHEIWNGRTSLQGISMHSKLRRFIYNDPAPTTIQYSRFVGRKDNGCR